jgi:hypothetical protein
MELSVEPADDPDVDPPGRDCDPPGRDCGCGRWAGPDGEPAPRGGVLCGGRPAGAGRDAEEDRGSGGLVLPPLGRGDEPPTLEAGIRVVRRGHSEGAGHTSSVR